MTGPRVRLAPIARLRLALRETLQEHPDVPALLAVLVREDGAQILAAQGGVRRRGSSGPANEVQPGDVFNIGSVSKPITGYVLTCAMDATGDLAWDATLAEAFPEFGDARFRARHGIRDEHLAVTLEHLMTHRSGLSGTDPGAGHDTLLGTDGNVLPAELAPGYESNASLANRRWNYLLAKCAERRAGAPGSATRYTSTGAVAAAVWLERRFRRPFHEIAAERLFTPLGVSHVRWGRTATSTTPDGVWQHDRAGAPVATVPNEFSTRPQYDFHAHGSAGKLAINADGLGRVLASLLDAPAGARPCSDAARQFALERPTAFTADVVRMGWFGAAHSCNHTGDNGISYAHAIVERASHRALAAAANVNSTVGAPAVNALLDRLRDLDAAL